MSAAVSLPMYDLPAMRPANEAMWAALAALLRREGYGVPDTLGIDEGPAPGRSFRDVLFTQTCGYPLQTIHRGQFRVLATPSYNAPGCDAMTHRAFIIVRDDDPASSLESLRDRRFALNAIHSNSGMNLPRHLFAPLARNGRFFCDVIETGSHAASLALLQNEVADAASIDCVTWAFAGDCAPALVRGLRVLAQTATSPSLPFVSGTMTPPALFKALQKALLLVGSSPTYADLRAGLRLAAIGLASPDAYDLVLRYERDARDAGYPVIA